MPYWSCVGASNDDEAVVGEMRDWYEGMAANPNEIIAYFQLQMRIRRVYDGPVDGVVNPRACLDPAASHIEVRSSHCGMAWNRHVYRAVLDALGAVAAA